ncbi:MAG: Vi polysaccharide biosynthesis UDP-N-acetylglucosamine C-6 dehydrogenase TviB, partial [Bacteroidetes bacterium]|nr:Vi polysaccharide biosynthesis UDP-N-acetylglucosamine C-6 dehydrogenase TviB [Bacteroidota bacterium]
MSEIIQKKIGVIGLGYVGLPLAVEFGRKYHVIGYDVNRERIRQLREGTDLTRELDAGQLKSACGLRFSCEAGDLSECTVYIITVPTPIDHFHNPDLSFLRAASETVGSYLRPGDLVVYESTVYPGCTEEDCVPILEKQSGLRFNVDFLCGYSPERINPGDRERTLTTILKVVAGSTPAVTDTLAQ